MFTDAEAMSPITAFDGDTAPLAYLDFTTAALPYHLLASPEVLVLGAGGGAPILLALYHQAARVDAVELNPQVIELVDNSLRPTSRAGSIRGRRFSPMPRRRAALSPERHAATT